MLVGERVGIRYYKVKGGHYNFKGPATEYLNYGSMK